VETDKEIIRDDYDTALKGREYWMRLKEKYSFKSEDCLILCAVEDSDWLQEVEKWVPAFAERKHFSQTIFLSTVRLPALPEREGIFLECIVIEKEQMKCLLKYYRLTQFTRYIYAIALEQPFGNAHMIGHKGITIQDWLRNFG